MIRARFIPMDVENINSAPFCDIIKMVQSCGPCPDTAETGELLHGAVIISLIVLG